MKFNDELKKEYKYLYNEMTYTYNVYINKYIVNKIINAIEKNYDTYIEVEIYTGVPWYFIACLHSMESNLDFKKHLHNGDSLLNKTVNIPVGRPEGKPPFTWVDSAIDAIEYLNLHKWNDWTIEGTLFKLEEYNGFGYRKYHPHVKSPYLWSGTNHYKSGKYIADGKWSETAISKQVGAAVILKELITRESKKHEKLEIDNNENIDFKTGRLLTLLFIAMFSLMLIVGFFFKYK